MIEVLGRYWKKKQIIFIHNCLCIFFFIFCTWYFLNETAIFFLFFCFFFILNNCTIDISLNFPVPCTFLTRTYVIWDKTFIIHPEIELLSFWVQNRGEGYFRSIKNTPQISSTTHHSLRLQVHAFGTVCEALALVRRESCCRYWPRRRSNLS